MTKKGKRQLALSITFVAVAAATLFVFGWFTDAEMRTPMFYVVFSLVAVLLLIALFAIARVIMREKYLRLGISLAAIGRPVDAMEALLNVEPYLEVGHHHPRSRQQDIDDIVSL